MVTSSIALANQQFALNLYSNLVSANAIPSGENVFFSPFSILAALSMLNVGAKGATRDQLLTATKLKNLGDASKIDKSFKDLFGKLDIHTQGAKPSSTAASPDDQWKRTTAYLALANRVYLQKGLKIQKDFDSTLKTSYNTTFGQVDFAGNPGGAKNQINQWVESVTNNRIKNLFSEMSSDVKLALVSAIYFKAEWEDHFNNENTQEGDFFTANGNRLKTRFMKKVDQDVNYAEFPELAATVLKKSYAGNSASMLIILPNKRDGLADLEKKLTASVFDKTKYQNYEVDITLPKFRIETDYQLIETLKKMGVKDAFQSNADFSGMADQRLNVGEVVHKAFIEVDEKGTEAAAATGLKVVPVSLTIFPDDLQRVFKADHPFLFAIQHDETGTVLFLGRVANPAA
ncbi:serpin B4-like [Paramacrobiotus metropolitanus]|uniref:serpin B4-like n=1 Tax=Paramacrobiotus metropolitanus TaxID=2943436 RepID=UPI0024465AE0|nr:serpin B4-like [Paramacrobiotus metropolitanus]